MSCVGSRFYQRLGESCTETFRPLTRFPQLHADKSIASLDASTLLHSFQINTFAPLLAFKHFYSLLPQKNDIRSSEADQSEADPANGIVAPGLGVLATVTAKIGSISDNKKGGASFFSTSSEFGLP